MATVAFLILLAVTAVVVLREAFSKEKREEAAAFKAMYKGVERHQREERRKREEERRGKAGVRLLMWIGAIICLVALGMIVNAVTPHH